MEEEGQKEQKEGKEVCRTCLRRRGKKEKFE
jgi:hypothetical protein